MICECWQEIDMEVCTKILSKRNMHMAIIVNFCRTCQAVKTTYGIGTPEAIHIAAVGRGRGGGGVPEAMHARTPYAQFTGLHV